MNTLAVIRIFALALPMAFFVACSSPESAADHSEVKMDSADSHSGHHGHSHSANEHMHERSFEELVQHFEDTERENWQKPEIVIEKLGDLKGKTIADLGAGSGYFSFRLAKTAGKVIALDVNDQFLDYMNEKLKGDQKEQSSKVEVRKCEFNSANLKDGEIDLLITVDTYHHIESREGYFSALKKAFKKNGVLWVVDFKDGEQPVGPPAEHKISIAKIAAELTAAGYVQVTIDSTSLPYQSIISAKPVL